MLKIENVTKTFNPGTVNEKVALRGLNLTTADTVILYDPWWNPAAEAQAMDRSHRIGQTRNVTCFKLFVRGSVEEKVLSLQKKKQDLFGALVEDSAAALGGMTLEDFEFLLK